MYLILLTLGFIAISALGLLARFKIRPSLCRLLAAGLALAGFIAFPILDEQITTIPPPPQFNFHEADENASGPATLLQVFAVDKKGFVTAQEIPLREAQTLNIPLGVYGSVDLKVDPKSRNAVMMSRKTRLKSFGRPFLYMRDSNSFTMEEMRSGSLPLVRGTLFEHWEHRRIEPLCSSKNACVKLSWRLIHSAASGKTFHLPETLAKFQAMGLSRKESAERYAAIMKDFGSLAKPNLNSLLARYEPAFNESNRLEAADPDSSMNTSSGTMITYSGKSCELPCSLILILNSSPHIYLILLAGFALFIALPLRLPLALPTATLVSLLFLLTLDNQNWRRAKLENDPIEAWRSEQHSLFFSQGEAEVTGLEKILLKPDTKIMQQVKP
jgi:hypothetical protein